MFNTLWHDDEANTGLTNRYAVLELLGAATGVVAADGSAAALNSTNWRSFAVALSDTGHPGKYRASVPSGTAAGWYLWKVYQSTGTPSTTAVGMTGGASDDALVTDEDVRYWSGTAWATPPNNWGLLSIDADGRVDLSKVLGVTPTMPSSVTVGSMTADALADFFLTASGTGGLDSAVPGSVVYEIGTNLSVGQGNLYTLIQTRATPGDIVSASDIAASLAGQTIPLLGIVNGGVIEVVRGDDYSNDAQRLWRVVKAAVDEPWPDDLTGDVITIELTRSPDNDATGSGTGVASATFGGSVAVATGDSQEVNFAPTASNTATLALGIASKGYFVKVIATDADGPKTLRRGVMTVRA